MNMNSFIDRVRELVKLDRKSLNQRAMKLAEETGEVNAVVLRFYAAHGTEYKPNVTALDVAEEAIDVMQVAISILAQLEITDEEISQLAEKKFTKWMNVLDGKELSSTKVSDSHSAWCVNGCKHPECPNL